MLSAACGETPLEHEPITCPTANNVPRYNELAAMATCMGCHASTLSGSAREGAPAPIDFDTFAAATRGAEIGLSAMERGSMPPDGVVDDADLQQWKIWSLCGKPE